MTKVAVVNSAENKEELLADAAIKAAYDHAYEVLTDLTRSESEINQACEVLTAALPQSEEHTLTYDSNGAQGKYGRYLYRSGDVAVLQSSRPSTARRTNFSPTGTQRRTAPAEPIWRALPPVSGRDVTPVRHLGTTSMPSPMT